MRENSTKKGEMSDSNSSLLGTKKCSKDFYFAFKLSTAYFEVVTFGLDFLEFGFKTAHLVDAFLSIPASSERVGSALLHSSRVVGEWAALGR